MDLSTLAPGEAKVVDVSLREEGVDLSWNDVFRDTGAVVSLREEGVDLSTKTAGSLPGREVSLREEGVDLSMWVIGGADAIFVSLSEEGVDLSHTLSRLRSIRRSPSARREWI